MLTIKPTQLEKFAEPVIERKRQIQLEKWKKQGFEVKECPEEQQLTLIDKEQGGVDFLTEKGGVKLVSSEKRDVYIVSNKEGQLKTITDPAGLTIAFKYDEEKRFSRLERGDHSHYQFKYDDFSHLRTIQYPDKTQQEFLYSPKGQLINTTSRSGQMTQYRYSKTGQLKQQIDPKGNITRFEHHNTDAPSALVLPNGDRHKFHYDEDNHLVGISINGKPQAHFIHDNKGTVAIEYTAGGDVQFTLSGENLVKASDETGTLKLEYDDQGRLLKETFNQDSVEYQRNKLGTLVALVLPDKTKISYERDTEQRVIGVADWKESLHLISYAANGAVQQIQHPNGTKVTQTTDQLGLVQSLEIQSPFYPHPTIEHYQYRYDLCDRVISSINTEHQSQFYYDQEGRLIAVNSTDKNYNESFQLDANGNCIRNQYGIHEINSLDQMVSFAEHNLSYDKQGNTTSCPTSQGQVTLQYNGRNQLVSITTAQGKTTHYRYDPLGRRIQKKTNSEITSYQWAGQQLIAEKTYALDGTLLNNCDYLYFPDSFYLMAIRQNDQIYYAHLGQRGEVLAMTDIKGEVVWRANYTAFGIAHISIEKIQQPWRLSGHYYDNETGLHYVLARYYSPHLGRFLSRDPLFIEGGSQNFYLYCDGDPLNRTDPTGEFIFTAIIIGAVIGAAIGAGIEAYRQKKAIERGEQQGYDGWGIAKAGAIGGVIGAVGGGVGAAVEGAFAAATAATIAGGAGIGAISGVASSLAEQCAEAALKDKPLDPLTVVKQAVIDGTVGAVIGAVTGGTGGFLARRARKGVQESVGAITEHATKEATKRATKEATEKSAKEVAEETMKELSGTIKFSDDLADHIKLRDLSVPRKRGIGGAHNSEEFTRALTDVGAQVKKKTPHPDVDGIFIVEYQMPKLDKTGTPTGELKDKIFTKTIYDPKKISDEKMITMGREAAKNAKKTSADGNLPREWIGVTNDGVTIHGYTDNNGKVKSFFVE